jgi:hypothetical protein
MNEDIFNLIPDSEEIILRKSFNELSPSEKTRFLQYMSQEEYGLLRQNQLNIKLVFSTEEKEINPDVNIKDNLLKAFPIKNRKTLIRIYKPVIGLITKRIPVYQTVLLLLIGIILTLKLQYNNPGKFLTRTIIDTVYVEKNSDEIKTDLNLGKERKGNLNYNSTATIIKKSTTPFKITFNQVDTQNVLIRQNLNILKHNISLVKNTKIGRSLNCDKNLYQVLVSSQ